MVNTTFTMCIWLFLTPYFTLVTYTTVCCKRIWTWDFTCGHNIGSTTTRFIFWNNYNGEAFTIFIYTVCLLIMQSTLHVHIFHPFSLGFFRFVILSCLKSIWLVFLRINWTHNDHTLHAETALWLMLTLC